MSDICLKFDGMMHSTMKQIHFEIVMPGEMFGRTLKISMIGFDPVLGMTLPL